MGLLSRITRKIKRFHNVVGSGDRAMVVSTCTLFYSYFRLHLIVDLADVMGPASPHRHARVMFGGHEVVQKTECREAPEGACEVIVEALVDPVAFPGDGVLEVLQHGKTWRVAVVELLQRAAVGLAYPLFAEFQQEIDAWIERHASDRPTMLDLGGRARSGIQRSEHYPSCDVTTFDIIEQPGVDVVGDAHELSRFFEPSSFDFAMSLAVFEHLAMPWKVAVELARVLKPGGVAMIFSHQTIGMHDLPWDFFRFSDASWSALFNKFTGFEVLHTKMTMFVQIVPRVWGEVYRGLENAGGFEGSAVIVRKIGEPTVDWNVRVTEILSTSYPQS